MTYAVSFGVGSEVWSGIELDRLSGQMLNHSNASISDTVAASRLVSLSQGFPSHKTQKQTGNSTAAVALPQSPATATTVGLFNAACFFGRPPRSQPNDCLCRKPTATLPERQSQQMSALPVKRQALVRVVYWAFGVWIHGFGGCMHLFTCGVVGRYTFTNSEC